MTQRNWLPGFGYTPVTGVKPCAGSSILFEAYAIRVALLPRFYVALPGRVIMQSSGLSLQSRIRALQEASGEVVAEGHDDKQASAAGSDAVDAVYMSPQPRSSVKPGQFDMVDMRSILDTPRQTAPPMAMDSGRTPPSKDTGQSRATSKLLQPHHVSHLTLKDRFKEGDDGETSCLPGSPECEYVEAEDAIQSPSYFKPKSPETLPKSSNEVESPIKTGKLMRHQSITLITGESEYDSFISVPVDEDEEDGDVRTETAAQVKQSELETIPEQDLYLDLDSSVDSELAESAGVVQKKDWNADEPPMGGKLSSPKLPGEKKGKKSKNAVSSMNQNEASKRNGQSTVVKLRKPRSENGARGPATARPVSMPISPPPEPPGASSVNQPPVPNKPGARPLPPPPSRNEDADQDSSAKDHSAASRQSSMPQDPPPLPPTNVNRSSFAPPVAKTNLRAATSPTKRPTSAENLPPLPPSVQGRPSSAGAPPLPPVTGRKSSMLSDMPDLPPPPPPTSTLPQKRLSSDETARPRAPSDIPDLPPPLPPAPGFFQKASIPASESLHIAPAVPPGVPGKRTAETSPLLRKADPPHLHLIINKKPPPIPPVGSFNPALSSSDNSSGPQDTTPETPPPPLPRIAESHAPRLPYRPSSPFLKSAPGYSETPPNTPKREPEAAAPLPQTSDVLLRIPGGERNVHPVANLIKQMKKQNMEVKPRKRVEVDKKPKPAKKPLPNPPTVSSKPENPPAFKPKPPSVPSKPAVGLKPVVPRSENAKTAGVLAKNVRGCTLPKSGVSPHTVTSSSTLPRHVTTSAQLPQLPPSVDQKPLQNGQESSRLMDGDEDAVYSAIDESRVVTPAHPQTPPDLPSIPPPALRRGSSFDGASAPGSSSKPPPGVGGARPHPSMKSPRLKPKARPTAPPPPRPQQTPPKPPQQDEKVNKKPAPARPPPPSKKNIQAAEQRKVASMLENEKNIIRTSTSPSPGATPKMTNRNTPKVSEVAVTVDNPDDDSETYSLIDNFPGDSKHLGSNDSLENLSKDANRKKKRSPSKLPNPASMLKTLKMRSKPKPGNEAAVMSKINGDEVGGTAVEEPEEGIYAGIDDHPGLFNNVNTNNHLRATSQWPLSTNNESNCTYAQLDHAASSGE